MPAPSPLHSKGVGWVVAQNALTLAILVLGPVFPGNWRWAPAWIGTALILGGAFFGIAGVVALGPNRTPYPKPRERGCLVQTGIYGVVRHPLYSSLMLLSLGWGLIWSSWTALVLTAMLALLLDGKARLEERWLKGRYPAYESYATRVARFIPGIY